MSSLSPRAIALLAGVLPATACFKPYEDLSKLDFTEQRLTNPLLTGDGVVVRAYDIAELSCPDGEPARMYAVFDPDLVGPAPAALVLHAGAFDYLIEPGADGADLLDGVHFRAESRLERPWALAKVWETLGQSTSPVDPAEASVGALPAALANAGVVQILPANCWGDLWHNSQDDQPNDFGAEAFHRDGLALAQLAYDALRDPTFAGELGVEIPVQIDPAGLHLVGLGDGGRGVVDLLSRPDNDPTALASVLVDSHPDLLSAYTADPVTWEDELVGLELIYGESLMASPDGLSLLALLDAGQAPARVGFVGSSLDTGTPLAAMAPTWAAVAAAGGLAWDTGAVATVHTNRDLATAEAAVAWMATGALPAAD